MKNWHIVLILAALLLACFLSQIYGIEEKENIYKEYDETDLYEFTSHYSSYELENFFFAKYTPKDALDYYGYKKIKDALKEKGWLYEMCIDEYAE